MYNFGVRRASLLFDRFTRLALGRNRPDCLEQNARFHSGMIRVRRMKRLTVHQKAGNSIAQRDERFSHFGTGEHGQ